jgi:hypothetical protein
VHTFGKLVQLIYNIANQNALEVFVVEEIVFPKDLSWLTHKPTPIS